MNIVKPRSLFFLMLVFSSPAFAEKPDAATAFQQLSELVGNWVGKSESGREHSVNYRLSAGGTVLVETWTLSPTRESMTLYFLDGESLMAVHYCPQGNQPRLVLVSNTARLSFEFHDGTNLQAPNASHQYSFWMQMEGKDHFRRNETYVDNTAVIDSASTEDPKATVSYARVTENQEQQ